MYLKILLLKKCETNVSDLRLEVSTSLSPPEFRIMFRLLTILIIGKAFFTVQTVKLDHKHVLCPEITHIESDHCPWEWAIGCAWSSFIATAKLDFIPSHTLLRIDDRSIGLNLEPTHYIEKIHFAVCIQPLYWYIDWLQLFEFIEIWTSQGVTHFFFYIYSVSQVVMDLLQYYSDIRVDRRHFRLAHSLANNDCLLRTQGADFVAFVDLDEYILTSSKIPLIEYIKKKSAMCPKCGSFAILHRRMYYSSPRPQNNFELRDVNFNWLNGIKFGQAEVDGPHKQIVRPKTVSVISTHAVRENQPGYVDLNQSEIFLLHASYRWSKRMFPQTYAKLNLFGEIVPILKEKFYEVAKYIYKSNHSTTIDTVLQVKVATCIRR
ncbi:unnamed protein product [Thelazia callipaeda]|uniref:Glycosyltransferase family 92 protein n=1 Tax=Thelazia callipaeda TaxID=103827 RepID=A0A0N5CX60_THECL|nr:unnamed protein product [Thelazia callipaeda]